MIDVIYKSADLYEFIKYLGLKFSSPGIPGTGGLNIWVLFTAFKITKNQLV